MKVYIIFEDGTEDDFEVLEVTSALRAIELTKERLSRNGETRKVKSFEVEEDFL